MIDLFSICVTATVSLERRSIDILNTQHCRLTCRNKSTDVKESSLREDTARNIGTRWRGFLRAIIVLVQPSTDLNKCIVASFPCFPDVFTTSIAPTSDRKIRNAVRRRKKGSYPHILRFWGFSIRTSSLTFNSSMAMFLHLIISIHQLVLLKVGSIWSVSLPSLLSSKLSKPGFSM